MQKSAIWKAAYPCSIGKCIGNARSVTKLQDGSTMILVTNFRNEPQYLTKRANIALVEDFCDVTDALSVAEESRVPGP